LQKTLVMIPHLSTVHFPDHLKNAHQRGVFDELVAETIL
jgi:hypothetical protein